MSITISIIIIISMIISTGSRCFACSFLGSSCFPMHLFRMSGNWKTVSGQFSCPTKARATRASLRNCQGLLFGIVARASCGECRLLRMVAPPVCTITDTLSVCRFRHDYVWLWKLPILSVQQVTSYYISDVLPVLQWMIYKYKHLSLSLSQYAYIHT